MATAVIAQPSRPNLAADVRAGLCRPGQKELPSKYLYDEIGSALFEVVSLLPEYGLTRADERLLQRHAAEIVSRLTPQVFVAELGSGTGKKTRWLLEALAPRQCTTYCPIEISPTALARCESELGRIDCISIVGFERPYLDGLLAAAARRGENDHLLVLFLGSTIGNFDRDAAERFLTEVRRILFAGDALLLGTDLEKPLPQLLAAYDDSIGATAAFNLNLLARINRELGADFDLAAFRHEARYNIQHQRVEMHLRSLRNQVVTIPRARCTVSFLKDETIWTESSHKYRAEDISAMARRNGFRCDSQWIDTEWPFAESLLIAE
ncbi:MAG TPA: L-histidine N(alpha)-methyltransferase [Candidatus Acidoferrales bacterium]|jgi:dimethylhistidine N-methyltransferase|nr:L-histidine N(alpha)-methyltransferase [Candidatus Acidoferrales bacterium]